MELAINTDFIQERQEVEEIEGCLRSISGAGFSHIHWCHDWDGDYLYAEAEMEQIRDWMKKYGLRCKGLHASKGSARPTLETKWHYRKDYTSSIEYNRRAGVELIRNRVLLAEMIGCREVVLHMCLPTVDFARDPKCRDAFYDRAFRSLDELQPICREKGVRICIENLFEAPPAMQLDQFDRLLARYPADFLGLCVDTGHANMVWGNNFADELLLRYPDRVYCLHIHDNFGTGVGEGFGDAHRIPGTCGIDWARFMKALPKTVYEMPLVLEVVRQESEETDEFLQKAHKAGEWLMSLMQQSAADAD